MFRITGLEISNLGAFENLRLIFRDKPIGFEDKAEIHILTGENGTGKSTLLEVLSSPIATWTNSLPEHFYRRFRRGNEAFISVTNSADIFDKYLVTVSNTGAISIPRVSPSAFMYREKINNANNPEFDIAFFAYAGYRKTTSFKLGPIQELSHHPLTNAVDFEESVRPDVFQQYLANTKTKEAIEKSNGSIEKANRFAKSISRIEEAVSSIVEMPIKFILNTEPLAIAIKMNGIECDFDLLPDGLKSIISWLGDLLMRLDRLKWENDTDVLDRNFILFLDEIEVHLHPAWQRKILPEVQKLFKNAQIFVSTHSPFVVNSVDGAWIYKFVKEGNNSKLAQEPFLSEDAKSYQHVLQEVFDIHEDFGVDQEKKLKEFYSIRNTILHGETYDKARFSELLDELQGQTRELDSILGAELRQLRKLSVIDF